ncbi:MAG: GGDEF domain-containing response regulator [Nannocystales bacterium]
MARNDAENLDGTVLVVDDDATSAGLLCEAVEAFGMTAASATDWIDALRKHKTIRPDVVLMDAMMPTVDGYKLTKILRQRSEAYLPVVFVTTLGGQASRRRAFESGADDVLHKPVDSFELRLRMASMLRIRHLATELMAGQLALAELAHRDQLTGLPNRRAYVKRSAEELERANRFGHPLGLLVIDVDHFKRVNDAFGHVAGDRVLASLGGLLGRAVRRPDSAYRYGGEEFVVLVPESPIDSLLTLAEQLRIEFSTLQDSEAGAQTLSIGVAVGEPGAQSVESPALFEAADRAVYRAKASGRNRVEVEFVGALATGSC